MHSTPKLIDWNDQKNAKLKAERNITFEELLQAALDGGLVDHLKAPGRIEQWMLVIEYRGYIYYVPYVDDGQKIFLKTAYPTRDGTRKYLKR
jgi:hypothetical protein